MLPTIFIPSGRAFHLGHKNFFRHLRLPDHWGTPSKPPNDSRSEYRPFNELVDRIACSGTAGFEVHQFAAARLR